MSETAVMVGCLSPAVRTAGGGQILPVEDAIPVAGKLDAPMIPETQ